jgi:hypothetical protein
VCRLTDRMQVKLLDRERGVANVRLGSSDIWR